MKKVIITLAVMLISLGLFAHSASTVKLRFDIKTKLLYVNFEHGVKNVSEHFISNIDVKVNDKLVVTHKVLVQDKLTGGAVVYKIAGLNPGDKIMVTTECNKGGKQSGSTTVK